MKIKKIVGACVAVASIALMSVVAQAAVYSVGKSNVGADGTVSINVSATPNTEGTNEDINGFAVKVSYDKRYLTPSCEGNAVDATGANCYASTTLEGVLVSDLIDGTGENEGVVTVAWANKTATTINAETVLATIKFTANKEAAANDGVNSTNLTITVVDYAQSASEKGTSTGSETAGSAVFTVTVVFGEADGVEGISADDATYILRHAAGKITLDTDKQVSADVDGVVGVSADDATFVLRYVAGKITQFPVEES